MTLSEGDRQRIGEEEKFRAEARARAEAEAKTGLERVRCGAASDGAREPLIQEMGRLLHEPPPDHESLKSPYCGLRAVDWLAAHQRMARRSYWPVWRRAECVVVW